MIHALAMAEKKYFKMVSSFLNGDKSYLKSYNVIAKQHRYNKNAIRAACRGQILSALFCRQYSFFRCMTNVIDMQFSRREKYVKPSRQKKIRH
ncbi:MAG: hypothetical protein HY840_08265 [Bacteroidetes bacterium]|nr:hypothetical protein [Bacteroidota bacterium]